jgi:hypothetical protein
MLMIVLGISILTVVVMLILQLVTNDCDDRKEIILNEMED